MSKRRERETDSNQTSKRVHTENGDTNLGTLHNQTID